MIIENGEQKAEGSEAAVQRSESRALSEGGAKQEEEEEAEAEEAEEPFQAQWPQQTLQELIQQTPTSSSWHEARRELLHL